LKKYARGKLIDLGCGKVPLFEAYKDYITTNVCVDWENTTHKNQYLDYECDLSKTLPFQDGEFDTVVLSDVLEHIPTPAFLWSEMSRILAPGGTIMVNTPFYYCLHATPFDYFRYTKYALIYFAETEGLEVLDLDAMGGTPEILADFLAKHLQFIPFIGKPLAIGLQSLTLLFVKTKIGKYISNKTSRVFPLGYFIVAKKSQSGKRSTVLNSDNSEFSGN
jgi:SAM-dependent methyltransferase